MAKSKGSNEDPNARSVTRNRRARFEFDIMDEVECGIVLQGSEVKSIRDNKISIEEAYAKVRGGEVWLYGCDIAVYPQATIMNHEPRRPRKLLLRKREIEKFAEAAEQKGLTLVPLSVYFVRGNVKLKLALARGKKLHDKRDQLRKSADRVEIRREISRHQ